MYKLVFVFGERQALILKEFSYILQSSDTVFAFSHIVLIPSP